MLENIELNKNGKNVQVNVEVITLADNLTHPYFSLIDISKNNFYPIGIAVMEMPYDIQILNYWRKYTKEVVISFNITDYQRFNTNSPSYIEEHELKNKIINKQYNYSFIGKVSRLKHKGNKIIIYFADLGWKFLQKVPKEFRTTYIANQSLDDAFQAMCEFLGVQFAYSIEDLHKYNFAPDGYSVQKDGQTIEDTTTILSEWGAPEEEEEEENSTDDLDDPAFESQGLMDYRKKKKKKKQQNNQPTSSSNNQNDSSVASETTNNEDDEQTSSIDEDTDDLSAKIEKYQEEFENKILDLFRGNTYYESNLVDPVLNYDSITITPKVPATDTSNMSVVPGNTSQEEGGENEGERSSTALTQGRSGITLQNVKIQKKKIALSYDEVNRMTVKQAQQEAQKKDKYYYTTIVRLRAHAAFGRKIGPYTDYSKFYY
ncbi:MAG: hypothetical protein IKF82_00145 [Bacilli bacterium]|nr:hypothetical protein [Bacilli bacterium]